MAHICANTNYLEINAVLQQTRVDSWNCTLTNVIQPKLPETTIFNISIESVNSIYSLN